MKNFISKSLFIVAFAIVISSCKKKTEEPPAPSPTATTQSLSLNIANIINGKSADFNSTFTTSAGVRYKVESLRYYISDIRLVKPDGSELPITGKYLLVNPAMASYPLGSVPVGTYKGIKFGIGVDSVANHADPTPFPASHPLAIQSPSIHWSWKSGYIFMMFEGNCDTTDTQTDVLTYNKFSHSFLFHIGTDMLYSKVDLGNSAFSIGDAPKEIKLEANLDNFFTNIDLKKENLTHSMGKGAPLAMKASKNIPTMFSIK